MYINSIHKRSCEACGSLNYESLKIRKTLEYSICKKCNHSVKTFSFDISADYENAQSLYFGADSQLIYDVPTFFDVKYVHHRLSQVEKYILCPSTILEVGAGAGHLSEVLSLRGHKVTVLEASSSLANILKKKYSYKVYENSIENFSGKGILFDVIVSMHVIEHVVDPLLFLRSAYNNVRPGGYALIATPNARSLIHRILKKNSPNYDEAHLRVFSVESLSMISKLSGWEIVNINTPEFSLDWLRVLSKFFRRLRHEDESLTAGKYSLNSSKLMLFCIRSFDLISYPIRIIFKRFNFGNELFIVLKRPC